MRNDARPIGEVFRDIAEHDRQKPPAPPADERPRAEQVHGQNKPFVATVEPADDELPDASGR